MKRSFKIFIIFVKNNVTLHILTNLLYYEG